MPKVPGKATPKAAEVGANTKRRRISGKQMISAVTSGRVLVQQAQSAEEAPPQDFLPPADAVPPTQTFPAEFSPQSRRGVASGGRPDSLEEWVRLGMRTAISVVANGSPQVTQSVGVATAPPTQDLNFATPVKVAASKREIKDCGQTLLSASKAMPSQTSAAPTQPVCAATQEIGTPVQLLAPTQEIGAATQRRRERVRYADDHSQPAVQVPTQEFAAPTQHLATPTRELEQAAHVCKNTQELGVPTRQLTQEVATRHPLQTTLAKSATSPHDAEAVSAKFPSTQELPMQTPQKQVSHESIDAAAEVVPVQPTQPLPSNTQNSPEKGEHIAGTQPLPGTQDLPPTKGSEKSSIEKQRPLDPWIKGLVQEDQIRKRTADASAVKQAELEAARETVGQVSEPKGTLRLVPGTRSSFQELVRVGLVLSGRVDNAITAPDQAMLLLQDADHAVGNDAEQEAHNEDCGRQRVEKEPELHEKTKTAGELVSMAPGAAADRMQAKQDTDAPPPLDASDRVPLVGTCADRLVLDEAITASSYLNNDPVRGCGQMWRTRLDNHETAWCAHANDCKQWLQWDFGQTVLIAKVLTKGRYDVPQWVSSYDISYSQDGEAWIQLNEAFQGNCDQDTLVENEIVPPITARLIRLHPIRWTRRISMRVEFLGSRPTTAKRDTSVACIADRPDDAKADDLEQMGLAQQSPASVAEESPERAASGLDECAGKSMPEQEVPLEECALAETQLETVARAATIGGTTNLCQMVELLRRRTSVQDERASPASILFEAQERAHAVAAGEANVTPGDHGSHLKAMVAKRIQETENAALNEAIRAQRVVAVYKNLQELL